MDPDEELEFEEDGNEEEDETSDDGGEGGEGTEEDADEEDEGEDESEEDEEESGDDLLEDEPKQSRSSNRFQTLSNRARDNEARAIRAEQELENFRAQQIAARNNGANAQRREEYLASLSSEDKQLFLMQEQIDNQKYQIAMQEFNYQDRADKATYDAKAAKNPLYAKYADEVEKTLANFRRTANANAPREQVLYNIIGERVVKQKFKPVQKAAAKNRMQKQKAKPSGSGRSDVPTNKRSAKDEKAQRMARLENYKF